MKCLLVDNSNTRTKFALCTEGGEPEIRMMRTADITPESLCDITRGWHYDKVCICSVVPWAAQLIEQFCAGAPVIKPGPETLGMINFKNYPGMATLGADRMVNAAAAVHEVGLPLVAVDMGTATTFDVVVEREGSPCFVGGVIAPGLCSMMDGLHGCTAQLPVVKTWQSAPVVGRNTQEAMGAAMRVGYPAMVDAILDAIEEEIGAEIHVVLTGGDAEAVSAGMRRECKISPLLTFRGIALALGQSL